MEVVDLYGYKSPNEFRDGLYERIKEITYRGRKARLIKSGDRAYDELHELLDSFAKSLDNYENTGIDKIESNW